MSSISSTTIGQFATGIWDDLSQPTEISVGSISGWVIQPQTVGKLNNLIGSCFQPTGYDTSVTGSYNYDVTPEIGDEEYGILNEMYQLSYFQMLMRRTAGAGGTQRIVQSLSEGDSKITYVSAAQLARVYSDNIKEINKRINYLVNAYNVNSLGATAPRSVDKPLFVPRGHGYRNMTPSDGTVSDY